MSNNNRRFQGVAILSLFLFIGLALGIALSTRFEWMPSAHSAENQPQPRLPLPRPAGPSQSFAPVAKAVMPAVVNVSTTRVVRGSQNEDQSEQQLDPFSRRFGGGMPGPRPHRENALGSGVIVSSDGYIVTNNHVVAKADEIRILLPDKREFVGKVVGTDPPTDVAVVKINAKNLPTLPWGDSDRLEVGEFVLAVGNPFALNSTVTLGIVSAVGRANVGIADYEDFIQTDAAINPGNSGGALVNARGELMGINTAIFSESGGYMGVGFAVPSNMARAVMDSLIKTGKVTRGWLGVSVQDINQDLAKQFGLNQAEGALVSEVMPNSPAAAAGVKSGDIILSFDGKTISSAGVLRNLVAQTPVGKSVALGVLRDNKRETLNAKIAEQPKEMVQRGGGGDETFRGDEGTGKPSALAGLVVRNLTPDIAGQLGLAPGTKGVVVTYIAPSSPAAGAGVQPGDVILQINRQPVTSIADMKRIGGKLTAKESVLLLINRAGSKLFLVVKPQ